MKTLLACLPLLLLVAACSTTTTPAYDARFGEAVNQARLRQTLNPSTGLRQSPPPGLDGAAAAEAVNAYHETFKTPPPVVNVINIGGAMGAGH